MIRKATLEDIPQLLVMGEKFINEAPYTVPYDEETCIELFKDLINGDESERVLVVAVTDENEVVGMFAGLRIPIFYNKNYFQSSEWFFWVEEEHRKNKYGLELKNAYEHWANYHGVHQLAVCTMSTNKSLIDWFNKNGYTQREYFCVKEA